MFMSDGNKQEIQATAGKYSKLQAALNMVYGIVSNQTVNPLPSFPQ